MKGIIEIEIMTSLPKYWCIENTSQDIRDWFAKKYNCEAIKEWSYTHIGYDGCSTSNGVHGCRPKNMYKDNVLISYEDFQNLVLNDNYSIY